MIFCDAYDQGASHLATAVLTTFVLWCCVTPSGRRHSRGSYRTLYLRRSWARWLATAILVSLDSPCKHIKWYVIKEEGYWGKQTKGAYSSIHITKFSKGLRVCTQIDSFLAKTRLECLKKLKRASWVFPRPRAKSDRVYLLGTTSFLRVPNPHNFDNFFKSLGIMTESLCNNIDIEDGSFVFERQIYLWTLCCCCPPLPVPFCTPVLTLFSRF